MGVLNGSTGTGAWGRKLGDKSMGMGAWGRERGDGSMWRGLQGWEHEDTIGQISQFSIVQSMGHISQSSNVQSAFLRIMCYGCIEPS